jgi:deoxycytidylate deaminase
MKPPESAIKAALEAAQMSPCRSQRGAAVFLLDDYWPQVAGSGCNYLPGDEVCDRSDACRARCKRTAVHAEQDAILWLPAHVRGKPLEVVHVKRDPSGNVAVSGGPSCLECSKLMYAAGIAAVWLHHVDGWRRYPIDEFHQLTLAAVFGG